jgi:hypothetical protein
MRRVECVVTVGDPYAAVVVDRQVISLELLSLTDPDICKRQLHHHLPCEYMFVECALLVQVTTPTLNYLDIAMTIHLHAMMTCATRSD